MAAGLDFHVALSRLCSDILFVVWTDIDLKRQ